MSLGRSGGVLPVDKPQGPSSRAVVNRAVSRLGLRRVGHAGTLDPLAEGLLLLAWGRATGLIPYLQEYPKTYVAAVRFGLETDTQDRTGQVVAERDASGLDRDAILAGMEPFRGTILQVPPMYSALKHEGRRLYRMARRGERVEVPPRECRVDRFHLLEWTPPVARFEVVCSKGTYVRTLAHDLGRSLETGACLEALERTAVGPYRRTDAVPADELDRMSAEEVVARSVDPGLALPDWPDLRLGPEEARAVGNGAWKGDPARTVPGRRYRILDEEGRLVALARGGNPPTLLRVFAETGA